MKNVLNPKKYESLVLYLNEALFLTILFVYTYKILLKVLNHWFPPAVNPSFFVKELFSPEPFEIPLFLILSIIWVIFIFSKFTSFFTLGASQKRWVYFLALLFSLYLNIGSYPLKNNVQFIKSPVDPFRSLFILALYLLTIIIIIVAAYRLRRQKILLIILTLFTIAFFTFEPGFPSSNHDTSYFLGPIYEIAHGKTIYTSTSSQYGFLSILILGFFTRFNIFNPFYLPIFTWFLYILMYFLCFYIVYKASRSIIFSLLGLFSILTINYFSLYHLPNTFPQIGPMRWFPLIISLFFVQRYKNITNFKLIFLFSFLSLWNVEAGIALFLTYAFTVSMLTLVGSVSKKKSLYSLIFFIVNTFTIFTILNIIHVLSGRQSIDFIGAFTKLREFAVAGIAMIPMPWRTHFWLVLLIYFATIIYFFKKQTQNLSTINNQQLTILLFSTNLSLFTSIYYVGISHPHNLFHISIFFLLNVFLFINEIFRNKLHKHISKRTLYTLYLILYTIFIFYPAYNRKQALASMISTKFDRLQKKAIFKPELEEQIKRYYLPESMLIKENLPEDEALILSVDDTYLFYLVDKKNLLLDNPQSSIAPASKKDLDIALQKAYKTCPPKIVASCRLFGLCPDYQTFNHEAVNIQKILLGSLEKACKVKYKPINCTNKLCISAST